MEGSKGFASSIAFQRAVRLMDRAIYQFGLCLQDLLQEYCPV